MIPSRFPFLIAAVATLSGSALAGPYDPSFTGLGFLAGGTSSRAAAISADGSTVVGSGSSTPGTQGFRYVRATRALTGLGDLSGGAFSSSATGVSADGSVIVGSSSSANPIAGEPLYDGVEAFRYQSGVMTGLGRYSAASGVSEDGTVVVGSLTTTKIAESGAHLLVRQPSQYQGGVWRNLRGVSSNANVNGISGDGVVTVGGTNTQGSSIPSSAYRWIEQGGGNYTLGDLPGGGNTSEAFGVSRNGAVVVGRGSSASGDEAFRWTAAGGMVGLGDLAGGTFGSVAHAISPNGLMVVGQGTTAGGSRAFMWDAVNGMVDLNVLLAQKGVLPTGWVLTDATGVTTTAQGVPIIVGTGIDPQGRQQAFVAAVPEPASMLVLGLGAAALIRRRRKG